MNNKGPKIHVTGGFHISEIFDSIEGEGKRTGEMAVFVRLTGCNLKCRWCDTKYALSMLDTQETISQEELLKRIHSYPWKKVTFTGGEPLLHPLQLILEQLGKEGYECNIETNGAVPLPARRPKGTFYTMDYKCTGSGMKNRMNRDNFKKLTADDVLKFVVMSRQDLDDMKAIVQMYSKEKVHPQYFVSPVWGHMDPKDIVSYIRENRLADVRLQLQIHKYIWGPDVKGV